MLTELFVAAMVALVELGLAGAVFVTVADPGRAVLGLEKVPVIWRLMLLFLWSVLTGLVLHIGSGSVPMR